MTIKQAANASTGGISAAAASSGGGATVNTIIPEDNILATGAIFSFSNRQNVYSTGNWTTSGANSTYYNDLHTSVPTMTGMAWNMLLGDGWPDATTGTSGRLMYTGNDKQVSRQKVYAHNRRLGHNYRYMYWAQNGTSYPGITVSCLPIRNHGTASASISLSKASSASGGSYQGSGLVLYTPTFSAGTNYANCTGGAWTVLNTTTSSSAENLATVTVTVPGKTTVLVMLTSSWRYQTTYQFNDTNLYYNLHTAFTGDIKCDLRMLETLHMGRSPAAAYNATAGTYEIYTTCASLFGDR